MGDYRSTLQLPRTAFPMRANLPQREPQMLARWAAMRIYQRIREARAGCEKFILHDGPPYANGEIHIGHAVNKVLKDIIVKAKGSIGLDAHYVPGWDCHGLPIELMVEQRVGKQIAPRAFRKHCREYAQAQVERQRADFQRLGVLGDWERPYLTMDYAFEANIIRAFGTIMANGHVQRGYKPVHWCIDCGSALAEAEVEYQDRHAPAIDVRFPVLEAEALLARLHHVPGAEGQGPAAVVIWTTTPWTLPANQAVCLHPGVEYALVQCTGAQGAERLLIAEALITALLGRCGIEDYRVLAYGRGQALEGLKLRHPFQAREVPIVLGTHVTLDTGSGAVHTAPAHGQEDYVIGTQYRLPMDNPVGGDGRFVAGTELFAGEHVFAANERVIEVLKARGALLHHEQVRHSYPHCWRHRTPVIFRATRQWFIGMDSAGLRARALAAIESVEWLPEWGKLRIQGMLQGRPDWCISRQRSWGVPIALFVHRHSGEPHPRSAELLEAVARRVERGGIDAWFDLDATELLGEDSAYYDKVSDTLDVWFDSGVTHACVLRADERLRYPADLYLEGSDQHRGWFQSALLSAVAMHGTAPYRTVLTHGFTVDAQGMKMSKSLGNVVAPQQVSSTLGADVLRLWVAATDYRGEMAVSDEILKRIADAYRRIRNTARFLLANLDGFDPGTDLVAADEMLTLDRWVLDHAAGLQQEIIDAYDGYQFHLIYQKLLRFCTVEMGSFYLDVLKDRQYTLQGKSLARRSGQSAMYHIVRALARWLAPILSFTAEEIWCHLPGQRGDSVFLEAGVERLHRIDPAGLFGPALWERVMGVREALAKGLERLRVAGGIGGSLDAEVHLYCEPGLHAALAAFDEELRFLFITSAARLYRFEEAPAHAAGTELEGLKLCVAASPHPKCERCWHHRAEVGSLPGHPGLCGRCYENVTGEGEVRRHV